MAKSQIEIENERKSGENQSLPMAGVRYVSEQTEQEKEPEIPLSRLQEMPHAALLALVQKIQAARWGYVADMKPEAIAEAMKLKLAHIALTSPEVRDAIGAIEKWLDRQEGKPMQRIEGGGPVINNNILISSALKDRLGLSEIELARLEDKS